MSLISDYIHHFPTFINTTGREEHLAKILISVNLASVCWRVLIPGNRTCSLKGYLPNWTMLHTYHHAYTPKEVGRDI